MRASASNWRLRLLLLLCVVQTPVCANSPLPTQWTEVAIPADGCQERLWGHTYFAEDRLTTIALCITVVGTVREVHQSGDGDLIVELDTDRRLVNDRNLNGWLRLEAVCQTSGSESKHQSACRGFTGPWFPWPPVGSVIRVTGRYVADRGHGGHMEIHPVSSLQVLR